MNNAAASITADQVLAAARRTDLRLCGSSKVYIIGVAKALGLCVAHLDMFKARLVELHRAREITLERCDLVAVADETLVSTSETVWDNAVFHFVRA